MIISAVKLEQQAAARSVRGVPPRPLPPQPVVDNDDESEVRMRMMMKHMA